MNPWEESALQYNFQDDAGTITTVSGGAVTTATTTTALAVAPRDYVHDTVIYPGLYAPSGFDMMSILIRVMTRPNPTVELGAVDASCALLMCDLLQPDYPVVYASGAFEALTGYTQQEILGRNCRFLQTPSPPPSFPTSYNHNHNHNHHHHRHRHGGSSRSNSSSGSRSSSTTAAARRHTDTTTTTTTTTTTATATNNNNNRRNSNIDNMKSIRQQMRRAIETNTELVVEVLNFRKDGRPFVNVLTMIPVCWDGCGEAPRYSVGFQAEKTW